jgi:hypothetical protein
MFDRTLKLLMLPITALFSFQPMFMPGQVRLTVPCLFKTLFDVECWGCGMTHAVVELWHGNLAESYSYNKLAVPTMCVLGLFFVSELYQVVSSILNKGKYRG